MKENEKELLNKALELGSNPLVIVILGAIIVILALAACSPLKKFYIEGTASGETYAEAIKEETPPQPNTITNGPVQ